MEKTLQQRFFEAKNLGYSYLWMRYADERLGDEVQEGNQAVKGSRIGLHLKSPASPCLVLVISF